MYHNDDIDPALDKCRDRADKFDIEKVDGKNYCLSIYFIFIVLPLCYLLVIIFPSHYFIFPTMFSYGHDLL